MEKLARALSSTVRESLQPEYLNMWIRADNPSYTAIQGSDD